MCVAYDTGMSEKVRITDVSPRDGLQNEPEIIATDDKIRLIRRLLASGVDEIEVTSFVSPRWVPQLADGPAVIEAIGVEATCMADAPQLSVLVPNEQGFEEALLAREQGVPLKIAMFAAASETFSQQNTNGTIAEVIDRFRPIVPRAAELEMPIRFYVSCVVECPFEGRIKPAAVRGVVDQLLELHDSPTVDIDLGETIGVATPDDINALLDAFEDSHIERMTLHLHDTQGRAADCVAAALQRGVRSFDGSAGGLGGCPYASTEERRAPGNIATESLVQRVEAEGFETGVDTERLEAAAVCAREIVLTARSGMGGLT